MHKAHKRIIALALFISVLATPNLAFDHAHSPFSPEVTTTAHVVKTPEKPLSELQKIAAHIREWPSNGIPVKTLPITGPSLQRVNEAPTSSPPSKASYDTELSEDTVEEEKPLTITRLDQAFSDYVTNTYLKRSPFR